jgi:KTSC domain
MFCLIAEKIYAYQDVPREEYDNLMKAESKGSYMRACIIDVYPDYLISKSRSHRR